MKPNYSGTALLLVVVEGCRGSAVCAVVEAGPPGVDVLWCAGPLAWPARLCWHGATIGRYALFCLEATGCRALQFVALPCARLRCEWAAILQVVSVVTSAHAAVKCVFEECL